jgi:ABC-type sugar transport system ATPase subunit
MSHVELRAKPTRRLMDERNLEARKGGFFGLLPSGCGIDAVVVIAGLEDATTGRCSMAST